MTGMFLACKQGDEEWIRARLGSLGASRVHDALAKTKTGWGASRANLMAELICERLTGIPAERFMNNSMAWGTEKEPEARAAYSFKLDVDVAEVGLIRHPTIEQTHASPDGIVGNDGIVEIKAPNSATHIETLLSGKVDGRYVTQMMWQIACCQRQWCDFVSYDPRLPAPLRLFIKRVPRDEAMIAGLEKSVIAFLVELDAKLHALRSGYELEDCLRESQVST